MLKQARQLTRAGALQFALSLNKVENANPLCRVQWRLLPCLKDAGPEPIIFGYVAVPECFG
jgi:hypothetical protein